MHKSISPILGILLLFSLPFSTLGQSYTSFFTGDSMDVSPDPDFGICMMGGASESNSAMVWFLEKANGGDVVVIRASGSDGYNDYMFSELGVQVNSVETIRFESAAAAEDPYVIEQLQNAEAIWMAGGDQYDYVQYWKDTAVEDAINELINEDGGAVGGTSAGMAVLGGTYFSAQLGTIYSEDALSDPIQPQISLGYEDFFDLPFMEHVITDTHYDDEDVLVRPGRHFAFLSKLRVEQDVQPFGIAAEEYSAICINEDGIARAFGEYPEYEDYVYFLQANCNHPEGPEVYAEGQPLTWNRNGEAVVAYKVPATMMGVNYLDLNDWQSGEGGEWQYWYAEEGEFMTTEDVNPQFCASSLGGEVNKAEFKLYPNPTNGEFTVQSNGLFENIEVVNVTGKRVFSTSFRKRQYQMRVDPGTLDAGLYFILVDGKPAGELIKR